MVKLLPSPDTLKSLFEYRDGVLFWKKGVRKNKVAGYKHKDTGYFFVMIDGKMYKRHRLVYYMLRGICPTNMQVDHINQVRDDDRIENLRLVTEQENHKNQKRSVKNKSGVTGVCWDKRVKMWLAQISSGGINHYLGHFKNKNKAIRVRKKAEIKFNFHPNHGNN